MRSRLAALGAVLLGLLTVALVPTPAAALSCVATATATPDDLVRGTPLYGSPEGPRRLFDSYDHVVVGRVTGIRPPASAPPPSQGGVTVDLDVLAVVNRPTTAATVTVTMRDHGEMSGYGFEVGKHYFVVVNADNSYGICGPTAPLSEVDPDPSRAGALLQTAAGEAGVPVAVPAGASTQPPTPPVTQGPPPADARRGPVALVAGSVAGAVGLAAVALVLRRRRAAVSDATRETSPPAT